MPNLLTELELEELSLVDRPANAQATVSLFKRDTQEINKMSDEDEKKIKAYMDKMSCTRGEAMKALGMKEDMEKMQEELDELKKANESLRGAILDAGFEITKDGIQKKAEDEFIEFEGEKVSKSDDRYELVKRLKEVEVEKAEAEILKRAEDTLPNVKSDVAVTLLKTADSLVDDKEFMEFLASIDALFEKQFSEEGSSNADTDLKTASEKLDALVKSYMEENGLTKKDFAKAYSEVIKTDKGRDLYKEMNKGD